MTVDTPPVLVKAPSPAAPAPAPAPASASAPAAIAETTSAAAVVDDEKAARITGDDPADVNSRADKGPRSSAFGHHVGTLLRRPMFLLAVLCVLFVLVSAFWPGLFATAGPYDTDTSSVLVSPNAHHLFGTDNYGRDQWSRMLHGSALTIEATITALAIAVIAGLSLGVLSGFLGGIVDSILMRIVDVLLAIPGLLLALSIVTALRYGTLPVAVAVGVGIIPGFARTTRAEVLRVKNLPFVEAARGSGSSWTRVLLRHILPNSWGPVAVLAVLDAGVAIVAIASLSFLGFGAAPPAAEWGTLIADGRSYLVTAWWLSLLPGLFVALLVLSLNHISKTLQEVES